MIQGGDPTGTGKGGESCWKAEFQDEFNNKKLSHNERGVLSMANRGKDSKVCFVGDELDINLYYTNLFALKS